MWLLARIFPVLIGDLVPRGDSNWDCFLKLLKICEICTAPVLSADSAAYLEVLVEEHHDQFKAVYPGISIIPKMHFMIHFAQQILKFGPLIQAWTMRHEAKLRIIKRAARVSNFKNICQSVAKRHQHLLCYYIHTNQLLNISVSEGTRKHHALTSFSENVQLLLSEQYSITEESVIVTLSFVKYNNITYKVDAFIMLSYDALEPTFGKIVSIVKTESGGIVLVLNQFVTEFYDNHYKAFYVSECHGSSLLCNITNLTYYSIFHIRQSFANEKKLYINFKHHFEF